METDISEPSSRDFERETAATVEQWSNWTTNQIRSAIEAERERTFALLTELLVDIQKDMIPEVIATLPALRGPAGPVALGRLQTIAHIGELDGASCAILAASSRRSVRPVRRTLGPGDNTMRRAIPSGVGEHGRTLLLPASSAQWCGRPRSAYTGKTAAFAKFQRSLDGLRHGRVNTLAL